MSDSFSKLPAKAKGTVKPFKIAIPQDDLDVFHTVLKHSRIAPLTYENLQEDRQLGISRKWLEDAKNKWLQEFNWREHESAMNSFPQFTSSVTDDDHKQYKVHFVALFSENPKAVPLMLIHGWPGSFIEFLPMLECLKNAYSPQDLPYHIIVPSLPGFAFSDSPPLDKDFNLYDAARIFNYLMVSLGFEEGYVAQGGDIGSKTARIMAIKYPSCKAVHVNFCYLPEPSSVKGELSEVEKEGLRRGNMFVEEGRAYAMEHGTRPSTIGLVLASNPLALLAWIGEKFLDWTDDEPPLDTILRSVTLYWLTETFPTSIYSYRQDDSPENLKARGGPDYVSKPFGYSSFPKEIFPTPQSWVATMGDLVFFRIHSKGGHFAALEQPDLLLQDIEEFIKQVW